MRPPTQAEINSTIHTTSQPTCSTAHCRSVAYATDKDVAVFLGVLFINLHTFNNRHSKQNGSSSPLADMNLK